MLKPKKSFVAQLALLAILASAGLANAQSSTWVAAAAHTPGLAETVWRTDVGVLNLCDQDAAVEIVLHTAAGDFSESFEVAAGQQQIFVDVVSQLTLSDEITGALELRSEGLLTVSSRTYNQAPEGTYGQAFAGLTDDDGLASGVTVALQQLVQNEDFRSNLGVLNMGAEPLTATVTLYDRQGDQVGSYDIEVAAGQSVQDNQPYLARFGRSDIVGGYALISIASGSGAWPYASIVDEVTGDPTTITASPVPECPLDLADRLAAIAGLTVIDRSGASDHRFFELYYEQPADHNNPDGPTFLQQITLRHISSEAPVVLHTAGYSDLVRDSQRELTFMLAANQLSVEHRFFASSTPEPTDWSLLTIAQAAADHHRIVEAFKPIYGGPWINTGGSKGGMTAVYHRRFYPDDVDATVPYVAPISFAAPDERYLDFVATRGDPECRQNMEAVLREALNRRATLLPMYESWAGYRNATFNRIGSIERAFESAVVELPFTLWQYRGHLACLLIPDTTASDQAIFDFIRIYSSFTYPTDSGLAQYEPYFYQAQTELGYPDVATDYLQDLLQTVPLNLEGGLPPEGVSTTFDPTVMADIADWVATEGSRLLFIYGENDPYTAGAFDLGQAEDSYLFTVEGGTHNVSISSLPEADQLEISDILERWTGVTAKVLSTPPPTAEIEHDRRRAGSGLD